MGNNESTLPGLKLKSVRPLSNSAVSALVEIGFAQSESCVFWHVHNSYSLCKSQSIRFQRPLTMTIARMVMQPAAKPDIQGHRSGAEEAIADWVGSSE